MRNQLTAVSAVSAVACASLLAASLAIMSGCQNERGHADMNTPEPAEPPPVAMDTDQPGRASVDQVKEKPAAYYGREVRVAGEVDEIHNERAFELEGTGWAFDDDITVLTKTPVAFNSGAIVGDDQLIVRGTVRRLVVAEIERELGWDLRPELEVTLRDRPVLIADSVYNVETAQVWTAPGVPPQPVASVVTIVTTVDPMPLLGQQIDLKRERVQSVTGAGLWIGPSQMAQVFVVPQSRPVGIEPGDVVRVTGIVRTVPPDATKQWDLPRDMVGLVREGTLFIDAATVQEQQQSPRT